VADADRELGITGEHVMRGLRKYLIGQLSGTRCGESLTEGHALDLFNSNVRARADYPDHVDPIATPDLRPSRILSPRRIDRLWQTGESMRLINTARRLNGN